MCSCHGPVMANGHYCMIIQLKTKDQQHVLLQISIPSKAADAVSRMPGTGQCARKPLSVSTNERVPRIGGTDHT